MWKLPIAAVRPGRWRRDRDVSGHIAPRSSGETSAYTAPRTPDGKPDLNGIWQAINTANWDMQDHARPPGPGHRAGRGLQRSRGPGRRRGQRDPLSAWALPRRKRTPRTG